MQPHGLAAPHRLPATDPTRAGRLAALAGRLRRADAAAAITPTTARTTPGCRPRAHVRAPGSVAAAYAGPTPSANPDTSAPRAPRAEGGRPAVGDELELTCERLGGGARGICLAPGGFVLMVPRALPGEHLRARVTLIRDRYGEAERLETLAPHARAAPPPCPHHAACGGCPLQALQYNAQLDEKRNTVAQLLTRVGGVPREDLARIVAPAAGAPPGRRLGYRNKLQFAFGAKTWSGPPENGGGDGGDAGPAAAAAADAAARGLGLGFLKQGTSDVVVPIGECLLQGAAGNRALAAARAAAAALGLEPHDAPSGRGVLRHLIIRSAGEDGGGGGAGEAEQAADPRPGSGRGSPAGVQLQVVIVTSECPSGDVRPMAEAIRASVPEVVSVVHSVAAAAPGGGGGSSGSKASDSRGGRRPRGGGRGRQQQQQQQQRRRREPQPRAGGDGGSDDEGDGGGGGAADARGGARALRVARSEVLLGAPTLEQRLGGLRFSVGPHSFFQTNGRMAEVLYDLVADAVAEAMGQLPAGSIVLDLYTGTGTIALSLARRLGPGVRVVGADVNAEAIANARSNAEANGGGGARFVCGNLDRLVEEEGVLGLGGRGGGVGVVVVDPARAGLGRPVVEFLRRCRAARVVYVSCNAATQARDVARLAGAYALRSVVPVDLFPQTEHVETVAVLERVGG